MNFESKYFDKNRIKPTKQAKTRVREEAVMCEWPECKSAAPHRAPKGRGREREYWHFCLNHVREYNQSYNFFQGMSTEAVASYQKDALTGHRPTWKMGVNTEAAHGPDGHDPRTNARPRAYARHGGTTHTRDRKLLALEKRSFDVLNLSEKARGDEIKARYKELVKLNHPDANGGDRSSEDRLRQIIQAYNVLKKAGFC